MVVRVNIESVLWDLRPRGAAIGKHIIEGSRGCGIVWKSAGHAHHGDGLYRVPTPGGLSALEMKTVYGHFDVT